ncbi:unnamed protein product [Sphacelaria rigidula]
MASSESNDSMEENESTTSETSKQSSEEESTKQRKKKKSHLSKGLQYKTKRRPRKASAKPQRQIPRPRHLQRHRLRAQLPEKAL